MDDGKRVNGRFVRHVWLAVQEEDPPQFNLLSKSKGEMRLLIKEYKDVPWKFVFKVRLEYPTIFHLIYFATGIDGGRTPNFGGMGTIVKGFRITPHGSWMKIKERELSHYWPTDGRDEG